MSSTSFLQTLVQSWLEKSQLHRGTFESFLNKIDTTMSADPITINELKEAFFSLKTNKSAGYDEVGSKCYQKLLQ